LRRGLVAALAPISARFGQKGWNMSSHAPDGLARSVNFSRVVSAEDNSADADTTVL
jgi:hypothetical protein